MLSHNLLPAPSHGAASAMSEMTLGLGGSGGDGLTEEQRIELMKQQSTAAYHPSTFVRRPRGPMYGVPPPNYICKNCNKGGHWIKNCPVVGLTTFEVVPRRATGMMAEELQLASKDDPHAYVNARGDYVKPILHTHAYAAGKKEKPPFFVDESPADVIIPTVQEKPAVPQELLCFICGDLLREAVLIPCCGTSFCDDCIRSRLLDSEPCPKCGDQNVRADFLVPNSNVRTAVMNFLKDDYGHWQRRSGEPKSVGQQQQQSTFATSISFPVQPQPVDVSTKVRIDLKRLSQQPPDSRLPDVLSSLMQSFSLPTSNAPGVYVQQPPPSGPPPLLPPFVDSRAPVFPASILRAPVASRDNLPPSDSADGAATVCSAPNAPRETDGGQDQSLSSLPPATTTSDSGPISYVVDSAPLRPTFVVAPTGSATARLPLAAVPPLIHRPPMTSGLPPAGGSTRGKEMAPFAAGVFSQTLTQAPPPQFQSIVSCVSFQPSATATEIGLCDTPLGFSAADGESDQPNPPGVVGGLAPIRTPAAPFAVAAQQPLPPGVALPGLSSASAEFKLGDAAKVVEGNLRAKKDAWDLFLEQKSRKQRRKASSSRSRSASSSASSSPSSSSSSSRSSRSRSRGRRRRRHRRSYYSDSSESKGGGGSRKGRRSPSPRRHREQHMAATTDWLSAVAGAAKPLKRPHSPQDWFFIAGSSKRPPPASHVPHPPLMPPTAPFPQTPYYLGGPPTASAGGLQPLFPTSSSQYFGGGADQQQRVQHRHHHHHQHHREHDEHTPPRRRGRSREGKTSSDRYARRSQRSRSAAEGRNKRRRSSRSPHQQQLEEKEKTGRQEKRQQSEATAEAGQREKETKAVEVENAAAETKEETVRRDRPKKRANKPKGDKEKKGKENRRQSTYGKETRTDSSGKQKRKKTRERKHHSKGRREKGGDREKGSLVLNADVDNRNSPLADGKEEVKGEVHDEQIASADVKQSQGEVEEKTEEPLVNRENTGQEESGPTANVSAVTIEANPAKDHEKKTAKEKGKKSARTSTDGPASSKKATEKRSKQGKRPTHRCLDRSSAKADELAEATSPEKSQEQSVDAEPKTSVGQNEGSEEVADVEAAAELRQRETLDKEKELTKFDNEKNETAVGEILSGGSALAEPTNKEDDEPLMKRQVSRSPHAEAERESSRHHRRSSARQERDGRPTRWHERGRERKSSGVRRDQRSRTPPASGRSRKRTSRSPHRDERERTRRQEKRDKTESQTRRDLPDKRGDRVEAPTATVAQSAAEPVDAKELGSPDLAKKKADKPKDEKAKREKDGRKESGSKKADADDGGKQKRKKEKRHKHNKRQRRKRNSRSASPTGGNVVPLGEQKCEAQETSRKRHSEAHQQTEKRDEDKSNTVDDSAKDNKRDGGREQLEPKEPGRRSSATKSEKKKRDEEEPSSKKSKKSSSKEKSKSDKRVSDKPRSSAGGGEVQLPANPEVPPFDANSKIMVDLDGGGKTLLVEPAPVPSSQTTEKVRKRSKGKKKSEKRVRNDEEENEAYTEEVFRRRGLIGNMRSDELDGKKRGKSPSVSLKQRLSRFDQPPTETHSPQLTVVSSTAGVHRRSVHLDPVGSEDSAGGRRVSSTDLNRLSVTVQSNDGVDAAEETMTDNLGIGRKKIQLKLKRPV